MCIQDVLKEMLGWWKELLDWKVEWRSAGTMCGVQCAIICGTNQMPGLFVDSLVCQLQVAIASASDCAAEQLPAPVINFYRKYSLQCSCIWTGKRPSTTDSSTMWWI